VALGLGLTAALLLCLARQTPAARANPGIYYVREGATGDCRSIDDPCEIVQRAVNLAISPGDEVWVTTGVYTENLEIENSVRLRGGWDVAFTVQDPQTPTILDGSGDHNVRIVDDPAVTDVLIQGLTLRNGRDGIHVDTGNVTIERCTIQDMDKQGIEVDGDTVLISATHILTAQQGIEVDGSLVQVTDVYIAHTDEEGLLVEVGGVVTFTASTIEHCQQQGIDVNDGSTVQVENAHVAHVAREGLLVKNGTVTFTGSTVEDCQRQGVQIDEGSLWLFDNVVQDIISDGVQINLNASPSTIISNVVRSIAENPEDYHGIEVQGDHAVIGNQVSDVDDRGIYARDGASTILNNVVYDTGGDGIRTADTSTSADIRRNTVYRAGNDGIDARGVAVTVTGNRVTDCADNGIKAEEIGSWIHVEANWGLASGVGIALQGAPVFTLTNNVVGDSVTASVELTGTGTGVIYHNTLVGDGSGGFQGTGLAILSPLNATLANNVVVSHAVGITAAAGATLDVSDTLLWGNDENPISGTDALLTPPLFVAPAQQDYHLLPNSPAVDAGSDVGVTRDVDGDPRLSPPDVGADEFCIQAFLPLVLRQP
jgi:hypothetical protein